MNPQAREGPAHEESRATISRRTLLAVSGVAVIGGLSGCVDRVASSTTNTTAAPAAVFAGTGDGWNDDETEVTLSVAAPSGDPHVSRLTPTLSGSAGGLSGAVELEGWVTSTAISMEDYNTPRSNRSIARPVDLFGDDIDENDETFRVVAELDAQLQDATAAAVAAISKRSARTGRNPDTEKEITMALDDMDETLSELRAVLKRCSDESCGAALENVENREADLQRAKARVENGEWDTVLAAAGDDIERSEDYNSPRSNRSIAAPDGPSDEELDEIIDYLDGVPVVGERFTVCLPDAAVPGGGESIRDAVTPARFLEYITGRADSDGQVYAWGDNRSSSGGDSCVAGGSVRPGDVCRSPHLSAAVSGPVATGGGLESVRASDGTVTVVNTPPRAEGGASVLVCPADGEAYEPDDLSEWGRTVDGGGKASPYLYDTLVSQVMVQPPECPHPFPALLYVGRGVSDNQLIYSGGWVIDDAALYADASTVLTMEGAARIVGIDFGDLDSDGDGLGDAVERLRLDARAREGARLYSAPFHAFIGYMLSAGGREGVDALLRKRPGRVKENVGSIRMTHLAVDAPVLHLVNAGGVSNEVRFKTGAELSGQVN